MLNPPLPLSPPVWVSPWFSVEPFWFFFERYKGTTFAATALTMADDAAPLLDFFLEKYTKGTVLFVYFSRLRYQKYTKRTVPFV